MADDINRTQQHHTLAWALCFEVGLGLVALVAGKAVGIWPAQQLHWPISVSVLLLGVVSSLPPLAIMLGLRRAPWRVMRELRDLIDRQIFPIFRGLSLFDLALISVAAGWGEELLFRGLLQAGFDPWLGPLAAILLASLMFGLVHFVSPAYFVLAAGISVYFGWLFWQFETLWIPILAHTLYDFLMLAYLHRFAPAPTDT